MNPSVETLAPIVESSGFTLVEQDDVAFSLSLCREVHRIYGLYQSDDLKADESVHLGLSLTAQILASLGNSVTKGMPAMRIEVAAAQAREMMAVLFGEPIPTKKSRGGRPQLDGRCKRQVGAAFNGVLNSTTARSLGTEASRPVGDVARFALPAINGAEPTPAEPTPTDPRGQAVKANEEARSGPFSPTIPDRVRHWIRTLPLTLRLLIGLLGCAAAAVVIDAPIAVVLLLSGSLIPVASGFLGMISIAAWGYKHWRRETSTLQAPQLGSSRGGLNRV